MSDQHRAEFTQQAGGFMTYPADGWRKLMFKAPLVLWRMGLGPVMGQVFVVIGQTGRKSGLPRYTITEYHKLDGKIVVPCAFGERAQWYKNIVADPHVTLQNCQGTQSAIARRVMDDDEMRAVYDLFMARNPAMFAEYLATLGIDKDMESVIAHKDRVVLLTFDPTDTPTPPPLEADLKWVWGAVGAALLLFILLLRPGKNDPT